MNTEIDDFVATEIGNTHVRTLSHYVLLEMPRTTIFSDDDPYNGDTIVTITWNTSAADTLEELHRRVVMSIVEHGFSPIKEASLLLNSDEETKITDGKVKLLNLLSPEVGVHVTFVG